MKQGVKHPVLTTNNSWHIANCHNQYALSQVVAETSKTDGNTACSGYTFMEPSQEPRVGAPQRTQTRNTDLAPNILRYTE